jgi:hypothetical protein
VLFRAEREKRSKPKSAITVKLAALFTLMPCNPIVDLTSSSIKWSITPFNYVDGHVHTNGLENFWSPLKRGISGTYVSVEPFHLFRYLDEQAYRFNNRKMTDAERFSAAVTGMVGKRLTFDQLTGKTESVMPSIN